MGIFDKQILRKPDLYPQLKPYKEAMEKGHWLSSSFTFTSDVNQFKVELNDNQRNIVIKTLSAIAQIEVAVKNFWKNLGIHLPHPSINDIGIVMANIEVIHNDAYEALLEALGIDWSKYLEEPVIKDRIQYLNKHLDAVYEDKKKQFVYSLVLFTVFTEYVSLFSQFYIITYITRFNKVLRDTSNQIAYTYKEENLHGEVGMLLINQIRKEYPEIFDDEFEQRIVKATRAAVEAEERIIDWILGDYYDLNDDTDVTGVLDAPTVKAYIRNKMNEAMNEIKMPANLEVDAEVLKNAQWFINETKLATSFDLFDKKSTNYSSKTTSFNRSALAKKKD